MRTTSAGEEPKGTPVKPLGRWSLSAKAERDATRTRVRVRTNRSILGGESGEGGEGLGLETSDHLFEGIDEGIEGIAVWGWGEDVELESGVFEHVGGGGDGGMEGTLFGGFLDEGEDGVVVALEDDLAESVALVWGSLFEEIEDGEGEFAFAEVGAEGFAGFGFVAREVEDIVIDLVSGAESEAEDAEGFDDFWGGLIEEGPELAGDGEEGAGFHLDNFVIIGDGESEVEAALGLDDFA
jgi:hypothetical protein